MKKMRCFLAVEIDPAVRQSAQDLIGRLSGTGPRVKWVDAENMHLTLKFFGEIELQDTYAISRAVERVTDEFPPFEIVVAGAGAFPNNRRPRTIWVGVSAGDEPLGRLQNRIEKELRRLGYRGEGHRRFHPHLTLGRVRDGSHLSQLATAIQTQEDCELGTSAVEEVALFQSELGPDGPIYSRLATCRLGARGGAGGGE